MLLYLNLYFYIFFLYLYIYFIFKLKEYVLIYLQRSQRKYNLRNKEDTAVTFKENVRVQKNIFYKDVNMFNNLLGE